MEPTVTERKKLKDRFVIFFHNMKDLFKEEESTASLEQSFPEEDISTLEALEECQKSVAHYEVQHEKVIDAIEKMSKTSTRVTTPRASTLSPDKLEKAKQISQANQSEVTSQRKTSTKSKQKDDNELSL